MDSARAS